MRRNSVNPASGLKKLPSPSCSATTISNKRTNIVAIWQHYKRDLSIFSPHMRRNGYFWTYGQKSDPAFRSGDLDMTDAFPLPCDVYWIYSMFLFYYVAWPCDLDFWPFDLEIILCTVRLMSDQHINFYYPTTIGYWVTSTEYLITFPLYEQSVRMRRVMWPLTGGKNNPHFWNPWPQFAYHFVTFRALRRRLSHVIGKK